MPTIDELKALSVDEVKRLFQGQAQQIRQGESQEDAPTPVGQSLSKDGPFAGMSLQDLEQIPASEIKSYFEKNVLTDRDKSTRREQQLDDSPLGPLAEVAQIPLRLGAGLAEALIEEVANITEFVGNMLPGVGDFDIKTPRIIESLEENNFLVEANLAEEIFQRGGEAAAFFLPAQKISAALRIGKLAFMPKAVTDMIGFGVVGTADAESHARSIGQKLTLEDHLASGMQLALMLPLAHFGAGGANKFMSHLVRRTFDKEIPALAKKLVFDQATQGAIFGATGAVLGGERDLRNIGMESAANSIGWVIGSNIGSIFKGPLRPRSQKQFEEVSLVTADMIHEMGLLGKNVTLKLRTETNAKVREKMAEVWWQSLQVPAIKGIKNRLPDITAETISEAFSINLAKAEKILKAPLPAPERLAIREGKLREGRLMLAKSLSEEHFLETAREMGVQHNPRTAAKWEGERALRDTESLVVTEKQLTQAMRKGYQIETPEGTRSLAEIIDGPLAMKAAGKVEGEFRAREKSAEADLESMTRELAPDVVPAKSPQGGKEAVAPGIQTLAGRATPGSRVKREFDPEAEAAKQAPQRKADFEAAKTESAIQELARKAKAGDLSVVGKKPERIPSVSRETSTKPAAKVPVAKIRVEKAAPKEKVGLTAEETKVPLRDAGDGRMAREKRQRRNRNRSAAERRLRNRTLAEASQKPEAVVPDPVNPTRQISGVATPGAGKTPLKKVWQPGGERTAHAVATAEQLLGERARGRQVAAERTGAESAEIIEALAGPDPVVGGKKYSAKTIEQMAKTDDALIREAEAIKREQPGLFGADNLPLVLLGTAVGGGLLAQALTDEEQSDPQSLAGATLLGLGVAAARRGKGPGRPAPALTGRRPSRSNSTKASRAVEVWAGKVMKKEGKSNPKDSVGYSKAQADPNLKPGWRTTAENFKKLNDMVEKEGTTVEQASKDMVVTPKTKAKFVDTFLRTVGHAMTTFGENGRLLSELTQRAVSTAQRRFRKLDVDLRQISDQHFNVALRKSSVGLRDGKVARNKRGDYDNLHDIMGQLWRKTVKGDDSPMDMPNNVKVESYVVAHASRMFGQSPESLAKLWGRPLSAKSRTEAAKLVKWLDDNFGAVATEALDMKVMQQAWKKGPYLPVMFPDWVWQPPSWQERIPGSRYKARFDRARRAQKEIVEDVAQRTGLSEGEILQVLEGYRRNPADPYWRHGLDEVLTKKHKNIELHRMLDSRVGIEWDIGLIVPKYFGPAYIRFEVARAFGPTSKRAKDLIRAAWADGYNEADLARLFDVATGQGSVLMGGQRHRLIDEAAGFVSASKLGTAGISQLSSWPRIFEHTRPKDVFRAFDGAIQASIQQSSVIPGFMKKRFAPKGEFYERMVAETGAMGQAELVTAIMNAHGFFPKVASLMLKTNLTTPLDRFGRNLAAISGRYYTRYLLEEFTHATGKTKKNRGQLIDELFRDPELQALAKKGTRNLSKDELYLLETAGGQVVGDRSHGRNLAIDMPLNFDHPILGQLYKLQVFNIRMTAESMRQFDARDPRSVIRNPAARARWAAALVVGVGVSDQLRNLKNKVNNRDPEQWEDDPYFRQLADMLAFHGVFTAWVDGFDTLTARYGKPGDRLTGVTYSTIAEMLQAGTGDIKRAMDGDGVAMDATRRFWLRSIPTYWHNVLLGAPTGKELARELVPPRRERKPAGRGGVRVTERRNNTRNVVRP